MKNPTNTYMKANRDSIARLLNSDKRFLTFAGTETFLLFEQRYPLRDFCAFEVLADHPAWNRLERDLLVPILDAAAEANMGVLTDTLCWRAAPDPIARLDYAPDEVDAFNRLGVKRIAAMIDRWQAARGAVAGQTPVILAAELGPRGDGYNADKGAPASIGAAWEYHAPQLASIAQTEAHLAVALTMTNLNEAIGIVLAAKDAGMPIVVSPTVETDGALPDGTPLGSFIQDVDTVSDGYPICYMVNCAHPTHLAPTLARAKTKNASWLPRLRGFRSNASCKSHAELDNSTELDRGDPRDLAERVAQLAREYRLNILGGCCGTNAEHLQEIAQAVVARACGCIQPRATTSLASTHG